MRIGHFDVAHAAVYELYERERDRESEKEKGGELVGAAYMVEPMASKSK